MEIEMASGRNIAVLGTGIETHTYTPRDQLYVIVFRYIIKYNLALRSVHNTCNSLRKVKTHHVLGYMRILYIEYYYDVRIVVNNPFLRYCLESVAGASFR